MSPIRPDRMAAPTVMPEDDDRLIPPGIRPRTLSEYQGQPQVQEQLGVFIEAARSRSRVLDHILVFGPPGLGKTTLAHIVAHEMRGNLRQTSGPILERAGDLAALITQLSAGDVLFIDEIHRLSPHIEEILYPVMEDFQLDLMVGEGPSARSIKLDVPPFTLIGATTRAGLLTAPLRDRFGIVQRLDFYASEDLAQIVKRSASLMGLLIEEEGALEIARRSRGTPRIANRLLRRVRDVAEVYGDGTITADLAARALSLLEVDIRGLDVHDRRLLEIMLDRFDGGPVGIDSLASALGEDRSTLEECVEPFLVQQGFIVRTPRGRVAGSLCYEHFNRPVPRAAAIDTETGAS